MKKNADGRNFGIVKREARYILTLILLSSRWNGTKLQGSLVISEIWIVERLNYNLRSLHALLLAH